MPDQSEAMILHRANSDRAKSHDALVLTPLCETKVCNRTRNGQRKPTHPEGYGQPADLRLPAEHDAKKMHYRDRQK
jgi:hypothetical protein